jgi:hypothetical protein
MEEKKMIKTFKTIIYGTCCCSCGCGTVLGTPSAMNVHWFPVVADEEDEEGYEWRIFTEECYNKLTLFADEIYAKFPAAPVVD